MSCIHSDGFLDTKAPLHPQVNPTGSWPVCSYTILRNANHECFKIFTATFLSKSGQKFSFSVTSLSSVALCVILALLFISSAAPLLLNVLGPFGHLGRPPPTALLGVIAWPGGLFPLDSRLEGFLRGVLSPESWSPPSCREAEHWAHRIPAQLEDCAAD